MKRITITLPDDLAALVAGEARRRGRSVSEVIRGFIVQGLSGSLESRDILWALLPAKAKMSFKEFLLAMPNVGEDADFERGEDHGRDVKL